ncbi:transposase [Corynebacterium uberis]|nr:transposase [Corynebacterium uberis]UDL75873.1 transposase [Corynebacterium uberis]UDL78085.1 transposase [Corynebacterium uberis]UDL80368.1 transposase [Corynebacterium uberis]UDL82503.1 transposase [Corynebacterium uberis]
MRGLSEFEIEKVEKLPDAQSVMDPSHVVQVAGSVLEQCLQRIQQETLGHRDCKMTRSV